MKDIYYMVRNESGSDGQYFLDGEYHYLASGQKEILKKEPVNATQNIVISMFKRETFSSEPHKIPMNILKNTKSGTRKSSGKKRSSGPQVIQEKKLLRTTTPYQRLGAISDEVKELEEDLAKDEVKEIETKESKKETKAEGLFEDSEKK